MRCGATRATSKTKAACNPRSADVMELSAQPRRSRGSPPAPISVVRCFDGACPPTIATFPSVWSSLPYGHLGCPSLVRQVLSVPNCLARSFLPRVHALARRLQTAGHVARDTRRVTGGRACYERVRERDRSRVGTCPSPSVAQRTPVSTCPCPCHLPVRSPPPEPGTGLLRLKCETAGRRHADRRQAALTGFAPLNPRGAMPSRIPASVVRRTPADQLRAAPPRICARRRHHAPLVIQLPRPI
jgi:hypothetical protein